ncbi:MAG TPA: hypothetical protein VGJ59_21675 [Jatrophihabitantaceae bacterium]
MARRPRIVKAVRFYVRTGRGTGVSVGIIGAIVLGVLIAAMWALAALIIAAVFAVAAIGYLSRPAWLRRRR